MLVFKTELIYVSKPFGGGGGGGGCLHHVHYVFLTKKVLSAHNWAELLRNPCVLRGPKKGGQNQKWLHNLCLCKVDS